MRPAACAALLVAAPVAVLPRPAHALVVGNADVQVGVNSTRTGFPVCVSGHIDPTLRVTGSWRLDVAGTRDGSPFTYTPVTSTAATFAPPCFTVPKLGAGSGGFTVTVAYAGAGVDVLAGAAGGGVWNGSVNQPFGSST